VIKTDILILGGGALGLSILNQMPSQLSSLLIERHEKFGMETSSRNSEVIHSGIYYPHGSLKTEHCTVGRNELYRFCRENNIPYRQCGKYVVATSAEEEEVLEELIKHCEYEIVPFQRLGKEWLQKKLPFVYGTRALFFPLSGIFDSHAYLACLERKAVNRGRNISYQTKFIRVVQEDPWIVEVKDPTGVQKIECQILINAAGLEAAKISNQVLKTKRFEHRYCRGKYMIVDSFLSTPLEALIYPVPESDGLGLHLTPDLGRTVRLGPDVEWVSEINFETDWESLKGVFVKKALSYLPGLEEKHLKPGFIGIRPKLFIEGQPYRDFLVENHSHFIHLLGIESPGLTASLSLGALVGRTVDKLI
jgi:L-2-hydroxyglutarate oxidase LhgO